MVHNLFLLSAPLRLCITKEALADKLTCAPAGCKRKFDVKAYIKLISDRIAKLKAKA